MRVLLFLFFSNLALTIAGQSAWKVDLDSKIAFYQTTDFGILLTGTAKSLYAVDGKTGEVVWRRSTGKINETAVAAIPGTDLVLLSRDLGSKSRLEAVDMLSGSSLWQSEKVKGDVLQMAVDPENDHLAVVLVKDANGSQSGGLKRKPVIHMLQLSDGTEIWKRDLDREIEMMPAGFTEAGGETGFTLDNYRAPLFLNGRLYLFYEGATSYDAPTGREKQREKFNVNESGLALTEADPVIDETHIFISGRGRIRAVDRKSGEVDWTADDLGITSEMMLIGDILYVRTGGQFTRLKDGQTESKGPYGVSAIDTRTGKVNWRYKGADKGLSNFVFPTNSSIVVADRDELITIDSSSGKRVSSAKHKINKAQFVLLNERRLPVVGGQDEIAAFDLAGKELWRVRHKAPARGVFRIVAGIALRATALYFRYGGLATSAFSLARGGLDLARTLNSFRSSGLRTRFGSFDLTTLASNSARNYINGRIFAYGQLSRNAELLGRVRDLQIQRPGLSSRIVSRSDVEDSLLDRLDPVRQAEKLSDLLLRRKRLSELRGNYMYFYTDLPKPYGKKGLVGVNVHDGRDTRFILTSDPDRSFMTDEVLGLMYSADGDKLQAFDILSK